MPVLLGVPGVVVLLALAPVPEVVVATLPVPSVTLDPAVLPHPASTIAKTPRHTQAAAVFLIDLKTCILLFLFIRYTPVRFIC